MRATPPAELSPATRPSPSGQQLAHVPARRGRHGSAPAPDGERGPASCLARGEGGRFSSVSFTLAATSDTLLAGPPRGRPPAQPGIPDTKRPRCAALRPASEVGVATGVA